jgi:hypothetical protein
MEKDTEVTPVLSLALAQIAWNSACVIVSVSFVF